MKIAARKNLQRAGLSAAAVVALSTITGCSAINPVATADVGYAPADGIVLQMDELDLVDILIVATAAEEEGRLLGAIENSGDEDVTVTVDTGVATAQIPVRAGETLQLEDAEPVILDQAGVDPGLMIETEFRAAGLSVTDTVPVLDHTFERYAEFVPGGAPSTPANPSNTPAPKGEPAPEGEEG